MLFLADVDIGRYANGRIKNYLVMQIIVVNRLYLNNELVRRYQWRCSPKELIINLQVVSKFFVQFEYIYFSTSDECSPWKRSVFVQISYNL